MIEGMKLIFFRIIYGLFIMVMMPVYNLIYAFVLSTNPDYCAGALPMVDLGVQTIKWIVFLGIAAGGYHLYYRAVMLRAYESKYSQNYGSGPFGGR